MSSTGVVKDVADVLADLSRDDRFQVDSHDRTLRVHNAGDFVGNVVMVAYDDTGAQWPILSEGDEYYIGKMDSRQKQFESIEVLNRD